MTVKVSQDVRKVIITCDSEIEAGRLAPVLKAMLERCAIIKDETEKEEKERKT
jgi:hypothetical protein